MERSQYSSFEEFLEISKSAQNTLDFEKVDLKELDEIAKAFIVNPEKYFDHVDAIYELRSIKMIVGLYSRIEKILGFRIISFFTGYSVIKNLKPLYDEYLIKIEQLRKNFEDLVPCELKIDLLPSRILETPPEWQQSGNTIHLIEIRVAINPEGNLLPNRIDLSFSVDNNDKIQFVGLFPATDFEKIGESEVGITNEGKFINKSNDEAKLGIGIKSGPISADAGLSNSNQNETSTSKKYSYNFKYIAKVAKVISDAVGRSANWRLFKSNNEIPVGGMAFLVNALIPDKLKDVNYQLSLSVELERFGTVKQTQSGKLKLSNTPSKATSILL